MFPPKGLVFFSPKILTYPPILFACRQNMYMVLMTGLVLFSFLLWTRTHGVCLEWKHNMHGANDGRFILRRNLHALLRESWLIWLKGNIICMTEEVGRSRRALHMEWKIEAANGIKNRGNERKNLHNALEGKYIHGACLPCTGVHYCTHCCSVQRRPWLSVRLSTGAHQSAGHRCRLPGGHRSTSHWQPSIWWQPTLHIILSLVNFCMVFAAGVPVAPSHTVCFQGMSTCHQRLGLSTVARWCSGHRRPSICC